MAWKSNRVMWESNNPYAYRNDNLRALGFKSYASYLRSPLWQSIRQRVIARDGGCCACCLKLARKPQVHHRAYDSATLRGDDINSLTLSCARCHRRAERPDDLNRARYDRMTSANFALSREKARRRARRKNISDAEALGLKWAKRGHGLPRLVPKDGPRKRSEVRA